MTRHKIFIINYVRLCQFCGASPLSFVFDRSFYLACSCLINNKPIGASPGRDEKICTNDGTTNNLPYKPGDKQHRGISNTH